jgi:predicted transcriptional regulator of viral defense system
LERGLYLLIPLEAGPARVWTENSLIIAQYLVNPAAIAYWSALHYWNMTEQFAQVVFVQTTRRKRTMEIAGVKFHFVTVIESHFFGNAVEDISGKTFLVTDREKTLIDCAARPDLSGGILQLSQVLTNNYTQINWNKLDQYLHQRGGGTVVKRLGYLIESLELPDQEARLLKWQSMITRGISLLEPGSDRSGKTSCRWQILINVSSRENEHHT